MHQRYGPIVRISPYELHFSDPACFEKLYRQEGRWDKHAWAYDAFGAPMSAICSIDHEIHKHRRAPLNTFFSKTNVSDHGHIIQGLATKLCEHMTRVGGSIVNITAAVSAFTRDVAMEFVLAKDSKYLEHEDFSADMTNILQSSGAIWRVTKHIRWVGPLMKSIPVDWIEKTGDAGTKAFFGLLKDRLQITKEVVPSSSSNKAGSDRHWSQRTIVHAILNSDLPAAEKTVERINDEVGTITGAAFETAAQSIRTVLYYLYSNPDLLQRLRDELAQARKEHGLGGDLPLATLEQLPLLTGVLCEGLRLSPGLATRLARVAPDHDLFYEQWLIPAGTPVGMTVLLMHLDESLYPRPREFNPERWPKNGKRSDKTFAPFPRGTRNYLGMHLAWAEMYIVVATMVQRLEFELIGAGPKDVEFASDQFIVGTADQTGIRGIVKKHKIN